MRIVSGQHEILELEIENRLAIRVERQSRQRPRRPRELLMGLLNVV